MFSLKKENTEVTKKHKGHKSPLSRSQCSRTCSLNGSPEFLRGLCKRVAAADSACQTHGIHRALTDDSWYKTRRSVGSSLSLSLSARGVGGVGRCLQSCIHCTSCVFSRWWVQTAGAPQTSEIHGVFTFCWKFGPFCLHHTLQILIRDCGEPEIFRNAPLHFPPKNEKTSKRFGTKPTYRKLHYVNNIASLIQTKLTFNLLTRNENHVVLMQWLRLSSNWQVPKFMIWKYLTNLVPWTTSSKLHTSFIMTLTRLEKSSHSCFKAIQN